MMYCLPPPHQTLQHICTAPMESRVTTGQVGWLFSIAVKIRERGLANSERVKYLVIWKISLLTSTNWHMLRVSGHGDQYHHPLIMMISITPPDTCWSPCYHVSSGWNNEGPLALYSIIPIIRHSRLITNIEQTEKLIPQHSDLDFLSLSIIVVKLAHIW